MGSQSGPVRSPENAAFRRHMASLVEAELAEHERRLAVERRVAASGRLRAAAYVSVVFAAAAVTAAAAVVAARSGR